MQLISMRCPACAANVTIDNNHSFFRCDYCRNQISIIKPTHVNSVVQGLNETEQKLYANYISILEQSIKAGNYSEAYNYCNKALEINPKSSSLWENKAICSFWLSSFDTITSNSANEIITYLNASKQNDPNSKTYSEIAGMISDNLWIITNYKYNSVRPNTGTAIFSKEQLREHLIYLDIMELCYLICPKVDYLKHSIDLLIHGKIKWVTLSQGRYINSFVSKGIGYEANRKLDYLKAKIQLIDEKYELPGLIKIKNLENVTFYEKFKVLIWIIVGIISFILLTFISLLVQINSK